MTNEPRTKDHRTKDQVTKDWEHFLRRRDLEQVLAGTPESLHGTVLDIGCGDGFLTTLLRQRFEQVIPLDIRPRGRVDDLCIANTEALPFPDGYFGLIFSSNVLEHLENLTTCLEELRRVMRDDAIMIHTMPTPTWKVLQLALRPLYLLFLVMRKLTDAGSKAKSNTEFPSSISPLLRQCSVQANGNLRTPWGKRPWKRWQTILWPPVHGVASSHIEEIKHFRVEWWIGRFHASGFSVFRTAPLYLHSAYRLFPYRGLRLREIVSHAGLSSVFAYWVRKH